ncbi:hypothetical protein [Novacetimonas maltaceti]|uniref:hypothetical protein n=1 Tax=Novacetimonas maltaceti TaxID=1203393 RepID=UPI0011AF11DF|nr:hypothetical protein [Novacetimonas maltaceti]
MMEKIADLVQYRETASVSHKRQGRGHRPSMPLQSGRVTHLMENDKEREDTNAQHKPTMEGRVVSPNTWNQS